MTPTTVTAIIFSAQEGQQKILLTKRNVDPYKEFWCFPGGHIDAGETAEQAVVREVKEETGLDIQPQFMFNFKENIPHLNKNDILAVFQSEAKGLINISPAEVQEAFWAPVDEAIKLPLAFKHNEVLQMILQKRS